MDIPLSISYECNHARELACAQYKLLIVLEASHAAKAITNLTTIGFSLTNSLISSTIFARNKEEKATGIQELDVCICLLSEAYKYARNY